LTIASAFASLAVQGFTFYYFRQRCLIVTTSRLQLVSDPSYCSQFNTFFKIFIFPTSLLTAPSLCCVAPSTSNIR